MLIWIKVDPEGMEGISGSKHMLTYCYTRSHWIHANKASQCYANDERGDCASGRVLLINLRLPLIIAACYKNVGGGWVSTGAVKQGGCAALNSALRSVMAQLRRGVYTYFMTEA